VSIEELDQRVAGRFAVAPGHVSALLKQEVQHPAELLDLANRLSALQKSLDQPVVVGASPSYPASTEQEPT
jgi:hypothetical protein